MKERALTFFVALFIVTAALIVMSPIAYVFVSILVGNFLDGYESAMRVLSHPGWWAVYAITVIVMYLALRQDEWSGKVK